MLAWPGAAPLLAALVVAAWSTLVVMVPQRLVAEVAGRRLGMRNQAAAAVLLTLLGGLVLFLTPLPAIGARTALSLAVVCATALAWLDVRLLVIPDLYVIALAALGLAGPLQRDLTTAGCGAALGGGLVWAVRWAWRVRTGTEGLGLGDVKLAAALGCLLGPEPVVRAIGLAAGLGAAFGLVLRWRAGTAAADGQPALIPFGAPLGLVGVGLLYWSRLQ